MLRSHSSPSARAYAQVIIPLNLPGGLTYGVPLEWQQEIELGMRVEVGLGRNKKYAGIVADLSAEKPDFSPIKPILGIIDKKPIIDGRHLDFWKWISAYYLASPGEVMQAALPSHLKMSAETRLIWSPEGGPGQGTWSSLTRPIADWLAQVHVLTIPEIRTRVAANDMPAVLSELLESGWVQWEDQLESRFKPKREKQLRLAPAYEGEEESLSALFDQLKRAPRQLELLLAYMDLRARIGSPMPVKALLDRAKASHALIRSLEEKGVFEVFYQKVDRLQAMAPQGEPEQISLSPAQAQALQEIRAGFEQKPVVLLQGVTGSGKTLIYIEEIREQIRQGKQVLYLLPEIGLTTHLVRRLKSYFGEEMGVYHSRYSPNERVEIWDKVREKKYRLILGPRSSLWLPFQDLGMIIVDEEHDISFKQRDPAPRFHARDAAIYLAHLFGARTLLGSATPSLETLHNVAKGKYGYVSLKERYQGIPMPRIEVFSARSDSGNSGSGPWIATPLARAMSETLNRNKQVILFHNRRGYAPFQICMSCGWVPQCRQCSVSMTYHKITDRMHCHYCGHRESVIRRCGQCGDQKMQARSFGTQRVEEEVQKIFPRARIARMDLDSMRGKHQHSQVLESLEKGQVDILIGTQMVVKGLDFSRVALVAILQADALLSFPDFRAQERAFQLMSQVSGRAGRQDGEGRVMIQAYRQNHPVIQWVKENDIRQMYQQEMALRREFDYPPYWRLIRIHIKHRSEATARQVGEEMVKALSTEAQIRVLGPSPALVYQIRGYYIQEVLVKSPPEPGLLRSLKARLWAERLNRLRTRGLQVVLDVDPY